MFIETDLQELRRQRFAPGAVKEYVLALSRHVRANWDANPGAVRSVWSLALVFFAVDFLASAAVALRLEPKLGVKLFLLAATVILPSFAGVSASIDLLRDRNGFRLSAINLPIALTLLRLAMLPGILVFLLERHFLLAFSAFLAAAASDVADGALARKWDQCTPLGTVLDPIVDIVFNLGIFAGLFAARLLPGWVVAMAGLRYGILLVGGAWLYLFVGPVRIQPTLFGRLTGVVMSALVGLLVLLHVLRGALAARLVPLTETALGVLLAATVVQVIVLGWHNLRVMTGKVEATGRVVGDVRWSGH
jgi:cardiolipin synthase